MSKILSYGQLLLIAILVTGCGRPNAETVVITGGGEAPTITAPQYLLSEEPPGARAVIDIRKEAKDGDDVLVVGKIGGEKRPFVKDRASFMIVDLSLKSCDDIPGDNCKTPWDYCCAAGLAEARLPVKFVDDEGRTLPTDARRLVGLKELQTVVVRGKARRDDAGNLSVVASGLYVRPKNP
jgi:hypothetical protein